MNQPLKKNHNIHYENRNFFVFADREEGKRPKFAESTEVDLPLRPGRPKVKRPIGRKVLKSKRTKYLAGLEKMVKTKRWSAFATATFDRRFKTPYSIYEHKVLKKDYLKYLPYDWEPTEWEPTKETVGLMMRALVSSLMTFSHKRWDIFYVIEEHKDGTPHIHMLLGNSKWGKGDIKKISEIWRYLRGGYIKIDEFKDKKEGAQKSIDYAFKYLTKQNKNDWDYLLTRPVQFRTKRVNKDHFTFENHLSIRKYKHHVIETGEKKRPLSEGVSLDF
jgi:hypothetical protein